MTHYGRVILILCLVLFPIIAFCEVPNFYSETWSMGPERFFKDGKEVSPGTLGAISGEVLARESLTDMKRVYTKPEYTGGMLVPNYKHPESQQHETNIIDHKPDCPKPIIVPMIIHRSDHHRNHHGLHHRSTHRRR